MNEVMSLNIQSKKGYVIDLQNLTSVVLAITIFLAIDPFFVWSSFAGGIGVTIFKMLQLLSMVLMIVQLKRFTISAFLCGVSVFGIFVFYSLFTGVRSGTTHPLLIGNILIYLFYALNVMTDRSILVKSFDLLRTLFAIVLAYTLVIYILILLGFPVPYSILQSGEAGRVEAGQQFYHNYLGCILINGGGVLSTRFTSVFTEPGVVGTFCAFLLAARDFNLKDSKKDVIFLISGILSRSLAFYLMIVLFWAIKSLRKGGYKLFAVLMIIIVAYSAFVNADFSNPALNELQERFVITEDGLGGDNRIHEDAEASYRSFLQSDLKTVLLGYGYPNSSKTEDAWQNTASYKESVYCLGVLGYGLMIVWFILTPYFCYKSKNKKKNYAMYSYIAIFMVSQYQRPYMKGLFLAYILLAGCLYIRWSVDKPQTNLDYRVLRRL